MSVKIYIDQGHNPTNPNAGAEGNGYREQDIVYTIGILTAEYLRVAGLEARVSRPDPSTQLGTSISSSLQERVEDANAWGADYFISLHANASTITSATGSEAYVFSLSSPASELGRAILQGLRESTMLPTRGIFPRPSLYVLRKTEMPAVLVELGFITNSRDAMLMARSPQLFARGVANGVLDYLGSL